MANVGVTEFDRLEQYLASLEQLFFSTFVGRRPDFDVVQDAFERLWYQVDHLYDLDVPVRTVHVHTSPARCGSCIFSSNSNVGGWMFRNRYLLGGLVAGVGIGCLVGYRASIRRNHWHGSSEINQGSAGWESPSSSERRARNQVVVVLGSENYLGSHLIRELVAAGFLVLACDSNGEQFNPSLNQLRDRVYRCSFNPEDPASISSLIHRLEEYGAFTCESPLELHSVVSLLGLTDPLNRPALLHSEWSKEASTSSVDAVNHSSYLMRSLVVPTRAVQAILPFFGKWRRNENENPDDSKPGSIIFCLPKLSTRDPNLTTSVRSQVKAARRLSSLGARSDVQSIVKMLTNAEPSLGLPSGLRALSVEVDPSLYFEASGSDNHAVRREAKELLYLITRDSFGHRAFFWPCLTLWESLASASNRAASFAFAWKKNFTVSLLQFGQRGYACYSASLTWIRTTAWPQTLEVTKTILFTLKHVNIQFQPIIIIPNPSTNGSGIQRVVRHPDGTLEVDGQLYALHSSTSRGSQSSNTNTRAPTGSARIPPMSPSSLVISMGERTFIPEDGINIKVQSPLIASAASEVILPVTEQGPEQHEDNDFYRTPSMQGSESAAGSAHVREVIQVYPGSSEKGSPEKLHHFSTESDSHSQESYESREEWISLHET